MEHFKQFFKQKGLYLACLAVAFAATAAGVLALRSILNHVAQLANTAQEEAPWQDDTTVNKPDTTQPEPARTPAPVSSASPSPDAASGAPAASPAPAASAAPSGSVGGSPGFWRGKVLAPYSGDELVYNATLGDWRTHNGVDVAAAAGEAVPAVRAGRVTLVDADGKPLRASLGYGEGSWGVGSGVADYVFSHEDAYPEQVYLAPQMGEDSADMAWAIPLPVRE